MKGTKKRSQGDIEVIGDCFIILKIKICVKNHLLAHTFILVYIDIYENGRFGYQK
ncbi:MAG: hypothetical protein IJA10_09380 [Lachnospiraceae bacterium]|nr:hypothetical protein [Lachnospiraceae bacterium]